MRESVSKQYNIGDKILIKTIKQITNFLNKNIGHMSVIYSYDGGTLTNKNYNESIIEKFIGLNTREFVITDVYLLNDIRFYRLHINNNESISVTVDLISKYTGANIDVTNFNLLHHKFIKKFRNIVFTDNNSMFTLSVKTSILMTEIVNGSFNPQLMFDISKMHSFVDVISLDKYELSMLMRNGFIRKQHIDINIK